jgi:hypothetical protein
MALHSVVVLMVLDCPQMEPVDWHSDLKMEVTARARLLVAHCVELEPLAG